MIKYLKDLECINLERLLLLRGKELSLTDEECHILLLIDTFVTLHKKMITPSLLLKYSSLTPHEMDHILDSLLKKKWIFNKNGTIVRCRKGSRVDAYCKEYDLVREYIG